MGAVRPMVIGGEVTGRASLPGDIILGAENTTAGAITTSTNGTWSGAAMATGFIYRSGPTNPYTDTTDSAANILSALLGSSSVGDIIPGNTMKLSVANSVAEALTLALGTGVQSGVNGVVNIGNSLVRDYILTFNNATPPSTYNCSFASGASNITLILGPNQTSFPLAAANGPTGFAVTPGQIAVGTGIPANTSVIGIIQGVGGATGLTLSTTTSVSSLGGGTPVTFNPSITITGIGTRGL